MSWPLPASRCQPPSPTRSHRPRNVGAEVINYLLPDPSQNSLRAVETGSGLPGQRCPARFVPLVGRKTRLQHNAM
jgi:hypothetical protein